MSKWYLDPEAKEFDSWNLRAINKATASNVSIQQIEPAEALVVGDSTLYPIVDTKPTLTDDQVITARVINVANGVATAAYTVGTKSDDQKAAEKQATTPASISASQLRIGLLDDGLLSSAEAIIAGIPDQTTQIRVDTFWKHSAEFERAHPYIGMIGAALGLDDDAIDDKFIAYKLI